MMLKIDTSRSGGAFGRARQCARRATACLLALAAAGCVGDPEPNFSQYPGFADYFRTNPRAETRPDAAERALLREHRPRLFVAAGAEGPIDFYRDYVAHGRLIGPDGRVVSRDVTRAVLNRWRDRPLAVFEHEPADADASPAAYGRVDRGHLPGMGRVTFLTWHFVFRHSGLPADIAAPLEWGAAVFADRDDWHQLDHYTAATLALDRSGRPFALMLMQHNYKRTYVLGRDLVLPPDGRPRIVAAVRSNELYPSRDGETRRERGARFIDAEGAVDWLTLGEGGDLSAFHDVIRPEREVDYALRFLPPNDAFYSFQGYLGERRLLPGRDGPPGADYDTLPPLQPLPRQLVAFAWRPGHPQDLRRRLALARPDSDGERFRALAADFADSVAAARSDRITQLRAPAR
ncbi:MAG: hypothetical protein U5L04_14130 [Trueperaceae bacterium]|nr:hypothetical protein [Trueperaceae bacterium]